MGCLSGNGNIVNLNIEKFEDINIDNIQNLNTHQKGNYGEWITNNELDGKTFNINYDGNNKDIKLSSSDKLNNSPIDLNSTLEKGIDHIYNIDKPPPDIVVVESKYGSGKLGMTQDGKQMSEKWIESRLKDLGFPNNTSYSSFISNVDKAGNVVVKELSSKGHIIRGSILNT